MESNILLVLDIIGTLVFSISGILAAFDKKFDLVGAFIMGFVTAVGGGTLRDILIGVTPVSWMQDLSYLTIIILSLPLCYFWKNYILKLRKGLFLFDTIGIGLFTIIGLEKALDLSLSPIIAILMGVVTAVFGGVIRDVLSNEIPLIFRKEIYATACFIGGTVFYLLEQYFGDYIINVVLSIGIVILIRYFAVKHKWTLALKPLGT